MYFESKFIDLFFASNAPYVQNTETVNTSLSDFH